MGAPGLGEINLTGDAERGIPAIYLWLWGCYGALAVAVQFLMPAPWRVGAWRMRTNWVLNITTIATILVFMGTNTDQIATGREAITYTQAGGYTYQNGSATRSATVEEARQIAERLIHNREAAIFKVWNMAAALAYLALGSYAMWWIVKRPEAEAVEEEFSITTLLRQLRPEPEHEDFLRRQETIPREDTRSREPTEEKISWR
jgi:hypothetical protein